MFLVTNENMGLCLYMCIYFYSMLRKFALPGWRHACGLKKWVLVFWEWCFGGRMGKCTAYRRLRKESDGEIYLKNFINASLGLKACKGCNVIHICINITSAIQFSKPVQLCTQFYQFKSICFPISTITLIFIKCIAFIDMRIHFYKSNLI